MGQACEAGHACCVVIYWRLRGHPGRSEEHSMHASPIVPLLHRWLRRACPAVHAARAIAVVTVVEALVLGAKLALTHLGRNLRSTAFAKHSIKRVDRLLGNTHLHQERSLIYRAVA